MNIVWLNQRSLLLTLLSAIAFAFVGNITASMAESSINIGKGGKLVYKKDDRGNQIPDFSSCGYLNAEVPIPNVEAKIFLNPVDGDNTKRIQAAIDYVSDLPVDENGFRGGIRLSPGNFAIEGQLLIRQSGIVLQGSGATDDGTKLIAKGPDRRPLIKVLGQENKILHTEIGIADKYVPVGANTFTVSSAENLQVGDSVLITRPSNEEWIKSIGAKAFGIGWREGTRNLVWDRVITSISGNQITVDAPITTAMEESFGGGKIQKYSWSGRIDNVGIEDLQLISDCPKSSPLDEDHAWYGLILDNVKNAWARRITFKHFSGGAIHLGLGTKSITAQDCISKEPVSELAGYRRHTYFTLGQLNLFNRCWSEQGIHDFSAGLCSAGPNAFVQCYASQAQGDSGPLESWASGVLFDNVRIEGNDLNLVNRWLSPQKTGWAAANCVLWQCRAANARCFRPPGANNWCIGVWAKPAGDGTIEAISDFVRPFSLYQSQLSERLGDHATKSLEPFLGKPRTATNPSGKEVVEFVSKSNEPARQLIDVIHEKMFSANKIILSDTQTNKKQSLILENIIPASKLINNQHDHPVKQRAHEYAIINGWLVENDAIKTGQRVRPTWWRGETVPAKAKAFGPNISRYFPGRSGFGYTDDIDQVASFFQIANVVVYEHHYGLWYDRRRDDHLMVQRADGGVSPPFYEQPFKRSGQGIAWDKLTKYDLTKPNPWYWNRLTKFADLGINNGILLANQHYFQHNILEAGAHWADCPWRPANNINSVELPEPPPYIGDKRLFIAHQFYDTTKPNLSKLHKNYIQQNLKAFAGHSNVLHMISAEYTGPQEFTEFWLDTIIQWQAENDNNAMIALSCTKDVQDAILADPNRAKHVDVIDIRYWTYDGRGNLYAPKGGQNLSPRQHLRRSRASASNFASILKAVTEYREKFPKKAILYNADAYCKSGNDGWAVLMGGGSIPNLKLPEELAQELPEYLPNHDLIEGENRWCLASKNDSYLIYTNAGDEKTNLKVSDEAAVYLARWIDTKSGNFIKEEMLPGESNLSIPANGKAVWIKLLDNSKY